MNESLQLPTGWKEKRLKDVGKCLTGLTYTPNDVTDDSGLLVLRSSNVQGGKLVFDDNVFVKRDVKAKNYAQRGDILVCVRNGSSNLIGKNAIITADAEGLAHGAFMMLFRSKHNQYLYQLFSSEMYDKQVYRNLGATINSINSSDFYKFKFSFPPLPEQKAIADLLSTWDEAIEKTERLIQAKGKQFKRLLNDLICVPAIKGKWKQVRIKSLFKERRETKRADLPLLSITNYEGVIPREDTNRKDTSNEDKSKYLRICPGDIGYNTMRMWQGVSALSSLEGIVSPAYTICIPGEKLSPLFVAYLFKMPFMIHRFYRYSQGLTSDTWNLKYPHFSEVKMPLPSVEVQQQIAETLSAAQQEIDLLKKLAEKIKTQKRGMMQKLLNGEWRVKPEIVKQYKEV